MHLSISLRERCMSFMIYSRHSYFLVFFSIPTSVPKDCQKKKSNSVEYYYTHSCTKQRKTYTFSITGNLFLFVFFPTLFRILGREMERVKEKQRGREWEQEKEKEKAFNFSHQFTRSTKTSAGKNQSLQHHLPHEQLTSHYLSPHCCLLMMHIPRSWTGNKRKKDLKQALHQGIWHTKTQIIKCHLMMPLSPPSQKVLSFLFFTSFTSK